MIGNTAGSIRCALNAVPGGNVGSVWLMADSTCNNATTIFVPQLKLIEISAEPRLLVERILTELGTARNACSRGCATSITILSTGISPESTVTTIRGNEIFGKSETGNLK